MNQNLNKISDLQITISSLFLAQNSDTPDTGSDFEINIKQEEEFPPPDQQKDQDFSNQSKSELFNAITNTFPSYTVSDLPHYIDVCLPTVPETAIKIYQNYDLPFLLLPTSAQFEGMSQFLFSTLIDVKLVLVIDTSPLGTFIIHQLQMLKIPQQVQFVLVSDITQCVSTLVQLATRFTSLYAKKSQLRFAQLENDIISQDFYTTLLQNHQLSQNSIDAIKNRFPTLLSLSSFDLFTELIILENHQRDQYHGGQQHDQPIGLDISTIIELQSICDNPVIAVPHLLPNIYAPLTTDPSYRPNSVIGDGFDHSGPNISNTNDIDPSQMNLADTFYQSNIYQSAHNANNSTIFTPFSPPASGLMEPTHPSLPNDDLSSNSRFFPPNGVYPDGLPAPGTDYSQTLDAFLIHPDSTNQTSIDNNFDQMLPDNSEMKNDFDSLQTDLNLPALPQPFLPFETGDQSNGFSSFEMDELSHFGEQVQNQNYIKSETFQEYESHQQDQYQPQYFQHPQQHERKASFDPGFPPQQLPQQVPQQVLQQQQQQPYLFQNQPWPHQSDFYQQSLQPFNQNNQSFYHNHHHHHQQQQHQPSAFHFHNPYPQQQPNIDPSHNSYPTPQYPIYEQMTPGISKHNSNIPKQSHMTPNPPRRASQPLFQKFRKQHNNSFFK